MQICIQITMMVFLTHHHKEWCFLSFSHSASFCVTQSDTDSQRLKLSLFNFVSLSMSRVWVVCIYHYQYQCMCVCIHHYMCMLLCVCVHACLSVTVCVCVCVSLGFKDLKHSLTVIILSFGGYICWFIHVHPVIQSVKQHRFSSTTATVLVQY